MTGSVLRVENLSKRYGRVVAVARANFCVTQGAVTAFLGENGAGKTTTLKLILGFLRPDLGGVEIKARRIGYVPEHPVFFRWLTGKEILACTTRLFRIPGREFALRLEKTSAGIGFDPRLLERRVQTYSRGNQKKFSYLQSLAVSPDLLIVDEPFSGLDPLSIKNVRGLFGELKKEGKSVFLSSHLISEVEKICDEFIIIKEGRILIQERLGCLGQYAIFSGGKVKPCLESLFLSFHQPPRDGFRWI